MPIISSSPKCLFKGLRLVIPLNMLYHFGVIRGIPLSKSEQDIVKEAASPIKIAYANCLPRRNPKNAEDFILTWSLKIAFHGAEIVFKHCVLKADYYISRPRQCTKCARLSHLEKFCRCSRCLKRGSEDNSNSKYSTAFCILCKSSTHNTADRSLTNGRSTKTLASCYHL